jgi:hypothetical protein
MSISVTDSLLGSINITDNLSGSVSQVLQIVQSYAGSVSEYYPAFSVTMGGSSPTFPISPIQFVYIKNLSQTATIAVAWTRNGGYGVVSEPILTLDPGAAIMFCETTTSNGITAMTLTSSSGTITAQLVLAG